MQRMKRARLAPHTPRGYSVAQGIGTRLLRGTRAPHPAPRPRQRPPLRGSPEPGLGVPAAPGRVFGGEKPRQADFRSGFSRTLPPALLPVPKNEARTAFPAGRRGF